MKNKYIIIYRIIKNKSIFKINKFIILFIINIIIIKYKQKLKISFSEINKTYSFIQNKFNLSFPNNLDKKITIGIFCNSIKNGGIERLVSLLINYLNKVKIFKLYLITLIKESNEFIIEGNINRKKIKKKIPWI